MKNYSEVMLHEVIDRLVRYSQHLKSVREEFFYDKDKSSDKILFLSSYENCLKKIFEVSLRVYRSDQEEKKKIESLRLCLVQIHSLHQKLSHLPRPTESNELKRFNRIINVQISTFHNRESTLNNDLEISIYMQEEIGEQTFTDPLGEFKVNEINQLISDCGVLSTKYSELKESGSINITIPRIDAANPLRWPTLVHELGHHIMKPEFTFHKPIAEHFNEFLKEHGVEDEFIEKIGERINFENWLTECWCDLFAAVLMGPGLWFSQYSAFLFSRVHLQTNRYPSPVFRLNLINRILEKRLGNTLTVETQELMLQYTKLFDQLDDSFENQDNLKLFHFFQHYFASTFFTKKDSGLVLGPEQFNSLIQPLLKYTLNINELGINELVNNLKLKLPIPSKLKPESEIVETFNSVQEIIQSAWIYKSKYLNANISSWISTLTDESFDKDIEPLFDLILNEYNSFDQSILKSIQVSEWFALFDEKFDDEKRRQHVETIKVTKENLGVGMQLVDHEIYRAIKEKEIRIIPLMDPKQIGSTSVDIRLGTSFQYYYPNQFGILDFTQEESMQSTQKSTKSIDLDFLQSTTLAPGHFLLGHSMEFIVLSDKISAQLDGRSSFARSGLEIHMTAGFVEPGYRGVLTFEFFNAGSNPIRLFPGMRIGQLRFIPVNEPAEGYSTKREAKYKGHLAHHHGLQSNDVEVGIIKMELLKQQMKGFAKTFKREEFLGFVDQQLYKGNENDK